MLYLVLDDTEVEVTWNIGGDNTVLLFASKVIEIRANGNELGLIYERFSNIPMPINCRIVNWYGDIAKFIIANLFNMKESF